MFTVDDRQRVHDHVLGMADQDARVVAGAVVGSFARGTDDRWSDLDLTFAVPDEVPVREVLDDWSLDLAKQFDAVKLFDLQSHSTTYRVFLLPGCLQVDISLTPASDFCDGPGFRLLFGSAAGPNNARHVPQPAEETFGYAVHHAVRARVCIERGRYWQAEHWISEIREYALSLACRNQGLDPSHGRGFDDLPAEILAPFSEALVSVATRDELLRALDGAVTGLRLQSKEVANLASKLGPHLRELAAI